MRAAACARTDKENPFAPAMVSQEDAVRSDDRDAVTELAPEEQPPARSRSTGSRPARPSPSTGETGRQAQPPSRQPRRQESPQARHSRGGDCGGAEAEQQARRGREGSRRERKEPSDEPAAQLAVARRRQPPRRAPLPAAKRELLVSVDVTEKRVAVLEDGRVAEVYLERPERRSIAGNIYKGVVDNVLPGMEAAFVEIGLEKNGFLFVDEIVGPELEGRRPRGRRITDLISRGEEVLVQAVKDPMKTKGARLTTEISLPGRFVVYVPNGEGLGVSRRLEEDERNRLRDIVKDDRPEAGRRDRPHGRRGRLRRGRPARPRVPDEALEADPGAGEVRIEGAGARSSRRPSCRCASRATSSPATSSRRWSTTTRRSSASRAT